LTWHWSVCFEHR